MAERGSECSSDDDAVFYCDGEGLELPSSCYLEYRLDEEFLYCLDLNSEGSCKGLEC